MNTNDDSLRDGDIVIDKHGLHSSSPSISILKSQKAAVLLNLAGREPHGPQVEEDRLSNASTRTEEECAYEANQLSGLAREGRHIRDWIQQGRFPHLCMPIPACTARRARPLRLEGLSKGTPLGRGSSGVVWRAVDEEAAPGCAFAVKEVTLGAAEDDERRRSVLNEIRVSYRAEHPHIVTCFEVCA